MIETLLYALIAYTAVCVLISVFLFLHRDELDTNHWYKVSHLLWFWGGGVPVVMIAASLGHDPYLQLDIRAIVTGLVWGVSCFALLLGIRKLRSNPASVELPSMPSFSNGYGNDLYWHTWWSEFKATALTKWQWPAFGTVSLILLLWQGEVRGYDLVFWAVYAAISAYMFRRPLHSLWVYLTDGDADAFTIEMMGADDDEILLQYHHRIKETIKEVQREHGTELAYPLSYRVIPSPLPNSYMTGQTLFITTGAFDQGYDEALIAHEIGHCTVGSGKMVWVLRLFVDRTLWEELQVDYAFSPTGSVSGNPNTEVPSSQGISRTLQDRVALLTLLEKYGGLGVRQMKLSWARWFRNNYYLADQMAVRLGHGDKLIELLEKYKQYEMPEPYMFRFRPTAYHRLQRLKPVDEYLPPSPVRQTTNGHVRVTA